MKSNNITKEQTLLMKSNNITKEQALLMNPKTKPRSKHY